MTVASEISRIEGNISAAYTAADAKGATMPATENSDNLATCISSISGGSSGKYQLLQRVTDDNNEEIGTVSGFFTDENNVEYAVVCLDAQYRKQDSEWASDTGVVTDLPQLYLFAGFADAKTATYNTGKIFDWCIANGYHSDMCETARHHIFFVDDVAYEGQIPNKNELWDICCNNVAIDTADTSASLYSSLTLARLNRLEPLFSSSQASADKCWVVNGNLITNFYKTINSGGGGACIPVLEIPNA